MLIDCILILIINFYLGVGEVSVYVHPSAKGTGVGDFILGELIKRSEEKGYWMLQAGVFPENIPSLNLHIKHCFREGEGVNGSEK
ncbi:N-acetyltransferase family protein [Ammoniphilus sp. 3BR4]|uniref:GNAT family N-acetyltransferase n=1 Tax=Ammoniphilus sp. 3BR4 TaxID=3158265 RepID=UPI003466C7FD